MYEALATYPVQVMSASLAQRVIYAEAAAAGLSVQELDPSGPAAAEIEALVHELKEMVQ